MKNFLSSKHRFTIVLLWSIAIGMTLLLFYVIKTETVVLAPIIIISLAIAFIVWILLDTRYVIKNHFLLYRSGPFRGRIDILKIKKIEYFSGLNPQVIMKPALDFKGFIIFYESFNDIYVSPKKDQTFLEELLKINPNIVVKS